VRAAFRQRCFWRFLIGSLVAIIGVFFGFILLIVPGVILCGIVALVQPAAVLERRSPLEAWRRSAEVGRPARGPLTIVFLFLALLPNVSLQFGLQVTGTGTPGAEWIALDLVTGVLYMGAAIALTRAFVALRPGAPPTPPPPPATFPEKPPI
jgi:hypothetical protein